MLWYVNFLILNIISSDQITNFIQRQILFTKVCLVDSLVSLE